MMGTKSVAEIVRPVKVHCRRHDRAYEEVVRFLDGMRAAGANVRLIVATATTTRSRSRAGAFYGRHWNS